MACDCHWLTYSLLGIAVGFVCLPICSLSVGFIIRACLGGDGAEIIKDHAALTYTLKPKDLEEDAEMACSLKVSDVNTVFPDVSTSQSLRHALLVSCVVELLVT